MNSKFRIQSSKLFRFSLFAFCLCVCCVPVLEKPECAEARNAVREFYSFHFAGDLKPSAENLKQNEKFLSNNLKKQLERQPETATDYFTQTDDYPKTFRVGECEIISPQKAVLGVLLFWKTETRSEQREIKVETVKENDQWLIDKVESK